MYVCARARVRVCVYQRHWSVTDSDNMASVLGVAISAPADAATVSRARARTHALTHARWFRKRVVSNHSRRCRWLVAVEPTALS